jgi:hypothetical protein
MKSLARRALRGGRVAGAWTLAAALPACTASVNSVPLAGPTPAPLAIIAAAPTDVSFTDTAQVASSAAGPILPLFAIPDTVTNDGALNIFAWGVKDAAGDLIALDEIGISGMQNPAGAVYAFVDSTGRPVVFRDFASGVSIDVVYTSATQLTATVCDPHGNALETLTATADANGNPQGDVLAGGSCASVTNVRANTAVAPLEQRVAASDATAVPSNLQEMFAAIAMAITSGSFDAGLAYAVAKFKAFKENPQQVPIGTPLALIAAAIALLFAPSILSVVGETAVSTAAAASTDPEDPYLFQGIQPGTYYIGSSGAR